MCFEDTVWARKVLVSSGTLHSYLMQDLRL